MESSLARSLNRLRASYPFGVPKRLSVASQPVRMLFVLPQVTEADVQFLHRVIENGLKWPKEAVGIVSVADPRVLTHPCVVACGVELGSILRADDKVIYSAGLAVVQSDPLEKRRFWEDIQRGAKLAR